MLQWQLVYTYRERLLWEGPDGTGGTEGSRMGLTSEFSVCKETRFRFPSVEFTDEHPPAPDTYDIYFGMLYPTCRPWENGSMVQESGLGTLCADIFAENAFHLAAHEVGHAIGEQNHCTDATMLEQFPVHDDHHLMQSAPFVLDYQQDNRYVSFHTLFFIEANARENDGLPGGHSPCPID